MSSSINPVRFPYNILTQTEVDERSVNMKVTWNDEELAQNQESPQEKIQAFQKEIHEYQCQLKPNLLPMNGSDSNSFPLEARKNKGAILENMAPLFSEPRVRASREKIISNPTAFIGSKLGLKDRKADMSNQEKYIGVILKQFYTRETIIVDYLNKIKDQETLIQQYKKEILQYQEKEKVLLEEHKKNLSIQKNLIETLKQYEAILSPHSNSSDIIIE